MILFVAKITAGPNPHITSKCRKTVFNCYKMNFRTHIHSTRYFRYTYEGYTTYTTKTVRITQIITCSKTTSVVIRAHNRLISDNWQFQLSLNHERN
jgi:hypothetical protein